MSAFLWAGLGLLVAASPNLLVLARGEAIEALVAYEVLSSVAVMLLVVMPQGFGRSGEFELPVLLALLLFGSGMVFVKALERWF
ncbi:MAG: hypothetical protein M0005_03170 [Actinomycetota bacterium]|nr:hypothetical protein [Actinomycetota bacterium]